MNVNRGMKETILPRLTPEAGVKMTGQGVRATGEVRITDAFSLNMVNKAK